MQEIIVNLLTVFSTAYWCRGDSDEANQCMGIIRRPWWSEANGEIWPICRCYTPTLFEKHIGIFNDHRESGPRFHISSEGRCFSDSIVSPSHRPSTPAGLTNTSSNSNLVFPGGLPSRYWPAQPCLASVGNQSWAAGWAKHVRIINFNWSQSLFFAIIQNLRKTSIGFCWRNQGDHQHCRNLYYWLLAILIPIVRVPL